MDANYLNEVEKLSRTLRANKVAQTESEARRMAEEMLATSKKVQDDFKARDQQYRSFSQSRNPEVETATKLMEQISANLARGGGRINVKELDLNKPLKELIPRDLPPQEVIEEDDDAVVLEAPKAPVAEEPAWPVAEADVPVKDEFAGLTVAEAAEHAAEGDDDDNSGGDDDDTEEEAASGAVLIEPASGSNAEPGDESGSEDDASGEEESAADSSDEEDGEFSVKEL